MTLRLRSHIKQMVQALKNCQLMFEDLHHTHTELIPDYSFTLLFSELRRNNECIYVCFILVWRDEVAHRKLFSCFHLDTIHISIAVMLTV